ncbi:MAG: Tim44 domain-containing protein [Betaproteobacteria bacterium]|nr:MAG: Tim44 domain-containing protein [Betaproteobacteria bacterium]
MASKLLKIVSSTVLASAIAFGASMADAKKFGGGKSVGSQRDSVSQRQAGGPSASQATPTNAAAAAPAAGAAGTAAAGAAAKTGLAKWAGPVAAIAAGLGLGLLFSQLGAGGFLMFLLVAVAMLIGLGFLARNMMRKQATANGAPMPYQAPTPASAEPMARSAAGGASAAALPGLAAGFGIPAGFDKSGFEDNAKKQFLALQAANDKGDLDAVRDFATDEFYNQIAKDVVAGNKEATQVDELNAELLGIETERGNYWASVEFSGKIREDGMVMGSPFRETWNLVKPVDGSKGWLLAGIQQG